MLRTLGRTDLQVAPLCLGGNVFGWTADEAASFAVLDAYLESGGNFVDTADSYSRWVPGNVGGESETILGRWMRARGNRQQVIVATKVGAAMGDEPDQKGLSPRHIMRSVEASLRRLQTDYIDLYQAHYDDPDTPQEETLATFDALVRQGKVRWLGASNFSAERLASSLRLSAARGLARYECLQPRYNLVDRALYEQELEPLCRAEQLGVITYSSLASGFLTGKYRPGQPLPSSPRATGIQERYMNARGFAILEAVNRVAARLGARPAQVALAWILARPGITAAIASATTVAQVYELLRAAELHLDPETVTELDRASAWDRG